MIDVVLNDTELTMLVADARKDDWAWTKGAGWFEYPERGVRWISVTDERMHKLVADELRELFLIWEKEASPDLIKQLVSLRTLNKTRAILAGLPGRLERKDEDWDSHPYLFNAPNGVIDLKSGALLPHDSAYMMTKISGASYARGAAHETWEKALESLPASVRPWYAQQMGLALVGEIRAGGVMVINQGGGSNGKSTFSDCTRGAMGDYAILLDEKVLTAASNAHSTETADLKGVRFGLLEETESSGKLNVNRVKKLVDTKTLRARRMRQNTMEWNASHTIFISSNNRPVITETDHATWRRLALVVFPNTYPDDPAFKLAMSDPAVMTAALAWMVEGAVSVLNDPLERPEQVVEDTLAWRAETDMIVAFFHDRLEVDRGSAIASTDLFQEFNKFLESKGNYPWADRTFGPSFEAHDSVKAAGVQKARVNDPQDLSRPFPLGELPVTGKVTVWKGIKFRDNSESMIAAAVVSRTHDWAELVRVAYEVGTKGDSEW